MTTQLESFDDQLRERVRAKLDPDSLSLNELARQSGINVGTLSRWLNIPSRSIRLDHAEQLARVLRCDLCVSEGKRASRYHPGRSLSMSDQLRGFIEERGKTELARSSGVPLSTITTWLANKDSRISCRVAFKLCAVLQKDLLAARE